MLTVHFLEEHARVLWAMDACVLSPRHELLSHDLSTLGRGPPSCVLVHTCVTLHHACDDGNVWPNSMSHIARATWDYMCRPRTQHLANSSIPSTLGRGASQRGGGCWRVSHPTPGHVGGRACLRGARTMQATQHHPSRAEGLWGEMWP